MSDHATTRTLGPAVAPGHHHPSGPAQALTPGSLLWRARHDNDGIIGRGDDLYVDPFHGGAIRAAFALYADVLFDLSRIVAPPPIPVPGSRYAQGQCGSLLQVHAGRVLAELADVLDAAPRGLPIVELSAGPIDAARWARMTFTAEQAERAQLRRSERSDTGEV